MERIIGRWWNGEWARRRRRDVWLKLVDGTVWRVEARQGDGDSRPWSRDYADEADARAMVAELLERGSSTWRDLTSLY